MASIVLGIVLGSSLGYNMPISVLIAKYFTNDEAWPSAFFAWGRESPAPLVPLVGWMIGLVGLAHGGGDFGLHAFCSSGCRSPVSLTRIYLQEEAAISSSSSRERASSDTRRLSIDPQFTLREVLRLNASGFFDGDGAAPYGHRRRVSALRHPARRSRLEHGGGEQFARRLGADRRAGAHRHGLAGRYAGQKQIDHGLVVGAEFFRFC